MIASVDGKENRVYPQNFAGNVWEMAWMPHNESILVSVQKGVQGNIGLLHSKTGTIETLWKTGRPYFPFLYPEIFSISADDTQIVFLDASEASPPDVWIMKSNGREVKRLTTVNPQSKDLALLGSEQVISWKSKDGTQIEGILVLPPGYQKRKALPADHPCPQWPGLGMVEGMAYRHLSRMGCLPCQSWICRPSPQFPWQSGIWNEI